MITAERTKREETDPARWASGLHLCGWAFLFLLDVPFGADGRRIDLFPDAIGYLLFAVGAGRLVTMSRRASGVRMLAAVLIPVGVLQLADGWRNAGATERVGFEIVTGILLVPIVWWLCDVALEVARREGGAELAHAARAWRWAFVAITAAGPLLAVSAATTGVTRDWMFPVVGIMIAALLTLGSLMRLMWRAAARASTMLAEPAPEPAASPPGSRSGRLLIGCLVLTAVAFNLGRNSASPVRPDAVDATALVRGMSRQHDEMTFGEWAVARTVARCPGAERRHIQFRNEYFSFAGRPVWEIHLVYAQRHPNGYPPVDDSLRCTNGLDHPWLLLAIVDARTGKVRVPTWTTQIDDVDVEPVDWLEHFRAGAQP